MEAVVQNLTEIDHYGDKEFKFSHFDKFGTMFRFHIQGSYTYQTKVGSMFTLLFYILVTLSFIYYFMRFADTTRPLVVMSEYEAQD
jgi:multidrug efflux pump subunit AcrB